MSSAVSACCNRVYSCVLIFQTCQQIRDIIGIKLSKKNFRTSVIHYNQDYTKADIVILNT